MQDLLDLNRNGRVDLAVTSRIHADIPDEPRASSLKEDLDKLDVVKIGSVTRLDSWRLGEDRLACDRFSEVESSIRARRTPKDPKLPGTRDWDHLHGHHLANRDVFLTWDKPVLRLAGELRKCLDLIIMAPEEFLKNHRHPTSDGTSDETGQGRREAGTQQDYDDNPPIPRPLDNSQNEDTRADPSTFTPRKPSPMSSKTPKPNLPHIYMAVGMLMAGTALHQRVQDSWTIPDMKTGLIVPQCLIYVFGIEVGIKAILQGLGISFKKTHDLPKLWDDYLPEDMQNAVNKRVADLCTAHPNLNKTSVKGILRWHRNSFVDWRYGDPTTYTDDADVERKIQFLADPGSLAVVLQALVDTYVQFCGNATGGEVPQLHSGPQTETSEDDMWRAAYYYQRMVHIDGVEAGQSFDDWLQTKFEGRNLGNTNLENWFG